MEVLAHLETGEVLCAVNGQILAHLSEVTHVPGRWIHFADEKRNRPKKKEKMSQLSGHLLKERILL